MHGKHKCLVLAAASIFTTTPTREKVQEAKAANPHSLRHSFELLGASPSVDWIGRAHEVHKKFKKMTEQQFLKDHEDLAALWREEIGAPVRGVSNITGEKNNYTIPLKTIKTKPAQLAVLNLLLKKRPNYKPYKKWPGTLKSLMTHIEKVKKAILKDSIGIIRVLPPAVAKGAYKSNEEERAKTGHTQSGKRKADEKADARKAKVIARRIAGEEAPAASSRTTKPDDEYITLADVARDLKMLPKVARAKARRYKAKIAKFEIKGTKYKFTPKDREAVAKILAEDARK